MSEEREKPPTKQGLAEKWSKTARQTFDFADNEARRLGDCEIQPEHLFLGTTLCQDSDARKILVMLQLPIIELQERAERKLKIAREDTPLSSAEDKELGLSESGKKVLEYSIEEAKRLNDSYVTSGHLLLGCVRYSVEKNDELFSGIELALYRFREALVVLRERQARKTESDQLISDLQSEIEKGNDVKAIVVTESSPLIVKGFSSDGTHVYMEKDEKTTLIKPTSGILGWVVEKPEEPKS